MTESRIIFIEQGEYDDLCQRLNKIGIVPTPYESLIAMRWFEEMKFCGCGCPEEVSKYIADILQAHKERSGSGWQVDMVDKVINNPEMARLFILYTLTAMDVLEHGSNVEGSWLTLNGERLLGELKASK